MQEIVSGSRRYVEEGREIGGDLEFGTVVQMNNCFASDYVQANKIRTKFMKIFEEIFEQVDFIATPTTRQGAHKAHPNDYKGRIENDDLG